MPSGVLIIAETREGAIRSVTAETASAGKKLSDELGVGCSALLIGAGVVGHAPGLGSYGIEKVYVADDASLSTYSGMAWLKAVEQAVEAADPSIILLSATINGKDLAPRIAALLNAGYAAACTSIDLEGGKVGATRPVYAGKIVQQMKILTPVAVISILPKSYEVDDGQGGTAAVETMDVSWAEGLSGEKTMPVESVAGAKIDLTEADRIVSGGRGMGGPENWHLLEDVAEQMAAALGASRAVVDAGWRPHSEQVGQTGKTVTPGLYVACGISGAMQHLAGMSRSKVIVAINKDPDAPIFGVADYGLIGDVNDVLPRLADELRHQAD